MATLSGCGMGQASASTDDESIVSTIEKRYSVIQMEEDRAVIIYASNFNNENGYFIFFEDERCADAASMIRIPIYKVAIIDNEYCSFTAEEYITALKGPDFPIEYLNNNNLTR